MISLALFALTACASVQIPPDHLARNQASIRSAEEIGALNVPLAKLHLAMAKDQTEAAIRMSAAGDTRATLYLARAESDAELALGLAREATVHAEALKAADDLTAVRVRAVQ
jgi:hypothetical protein